MRKVGIIGIGQVPVMEHWDGGLRELAVQAILNAMDDANIDHADALYVGNMLSGYLSDQSNLGALIAEYVGIEFKEAISVEAACGSGASAFRQAVLSVASGSNDIAIAVGVEKLTEHSDISPTNGLATAADADYEAAMGLSFVSINALLMRRYMFEHNCSKTDFSGFVINAHDNARYNPNAMFRSKISNEQYNNAKLIADPINLLDSSPIADGAAAVIVCSLDLIKKITNKTLEVLSCETGMDSIALNKRKNPLHLKAVEMSTKRAMSSSGISHKDVDIFELHDAFSIMTVLSLESSGYSEKGKGIHFSSPDKIGITGSLPISTFGGLKARGHPVGATGLYQIVEAAMQLRGEAPDELQVDNPKIAMTQNIGGSASVVLTSILKKMV